MPKVRAKVLAVKIENGKFLAKLEFNERLPKIGDLLVCKWGKYRSTSQNSLYWAFLTFLWQDCSLKDEYNTVEELHETLKATFLSKRILVKGLEIIKVGSTTTLDKLAFSEYMERIDKAMTEYHHISTAPFWDEVRNREAGPVVQKQPETPEPF